MERAPLYLALARKLRAEILSRGRKSIRIPTEAQLCEEHAVSRVTVRKALEILAAEGLIVRRPRLGTFSKPPFPLAPQATAGLLVGINIMERPGTLGFTSLEALGAAEFLERQGMHLAMKSAPREARQAQEFLVGVVESRIAGFLCHSHGDEIVRAMAAAALNAGLPTVLLNTRQDDIPLDRVTCDNFLGGRIAAEYLLELGHRNVAFLAAAQDVSARDRWDGFAGRMAEAGVKPRCYTPWHRGDGLQGLLEDLHRLSAVFCAHDSLAARFMQEAAARGRVVPRDLSVLGYDNSIDVCEHARVPITSIEQPARAMGARAAQFLWERLSGRQPPKARRDQLAPRLVVRASAAALRQ